ncbi:hypothetical protein D770_25275 [Flammeovirgaceae bacterium 311]|nr:hypothetical protein D770_25275 [Flammeovirgaceae bacterium 311]
MRHLLELVITFFITSVAFGQQRSVATQQILWLGYYQKAQLSERWALHTELEGRWFTSNGRQHQWVAPRVHLHYLTLGGADLSAGGADLSAGGAYFLQALPQNDEPLQLVRPEIRPHQELTLRQSLGKFRLEHRYRVEERFLRRIMDGALADGWDFNWRFRYRAQLLVPLASGLRLNPTLKLYNEILLNAGKAVQQNLFDQNRIGATLSLKISKHIFTELGYLHWYQQRPAGNAFYNRHIFRFSLIHNLSLRK